jgi:hypothetical protein
MRLRRKGAGKQDLRCALTYKRGQPAFIRSEPEREIQRSMARVGNGPANRRVATNPGRDRVPRFFDKLIRRVP